MTTASLIRMGKNPKITKKTTTIETKNKSTHQNFRGFQNFQLT